MDTENNNDDTKQESKTIISYNALRESLSNTPKADIYNWLTKKTFLEKIKEENFAGDVGLRNLINELHKNELYNNEISTINTKIKENLEKIERKEDPQKSIDELKKNIEELNNKREIQFLLDCITEKSHDSIEGNCELKDNFFSEKEKRAFVVSIDIRRSTELMLKARSPKLFADFITNFCSETVNIFKNNFAVVDKFTGDGILAFFPEFFAGNDAGYYALKSAEEANNTFNTLYKKYRTSFSTILRDVGLGSGIDYGNVHLVRMAGSLTIVGQPVVYACRLGGAPAGKIYLNQPAFEEISLKYAHITSISEVSIDIKSEGALICYDAKLLDKNYIPSLPEWYK